MEEGADLVDGKGEEEGRGNERLGLALTSTTHAPHKLHTGDTAGI